MRILIINPNTSEFITQIIEQGALRHASPGTEIKTVTGSLGAALITGRSESAIGCYSAIELAAEYYDGYDAVLLAIASDAGLGAIRELLPIPVVGIGEAAMITACMLSSKFGAVTFGDRVLTLYDELVSSYGFNQRYLGIHPIHNVDEADLLDPLRKKNEIVAAVEYMVNEKGAEAVVLAGSLFAGMGELLRDQCSVPIIDGVACGIRLAEMMVHLNYAKPLSGSYQLPSHKEMSNANEHLSKMYIGLPDS